MRPQSEQEIIKLFSAAWEENPELAFRALLYGRDIRGQGLGERRLFKILLPFVSSKRPEWICNNLSLFVKLGRWDDLFCLFGTANEVDMLNLVRKQLCKDLNNYTLGDPSKVSLLAKWMPREKASSKQSREWAKKFINDLNMSPQAYRRAISRLTAHLKTVETFMSANKWNEITYSTVPSVCMNKNHKAFEKHDKLRFFNFIEKVRSGQEKINSSALFPYNLTKTYIPSYIRADKQDNVVEAQWAALPNYLENDNSNVLCMCDTSSSMYGRPLQTSVGLSIYFAKHNEGDFANKFMTFSTNPSFVSLEGANTLFDCVRRVAKAEVGYSTNLSAAYRTLLNFAVSNSVPKEYMPKVFVVISDMEIDYYYCYDDSAFVFLKTMEKEYNSYGYDLPICVMWNVEARQNTYLNQNTNSKVRFLSGQSASVFKSLINTIESPDAYKAMLKILMDERYNFVC